MFDKIETIGKSLIQHGPNNDRVYLMKLHPDDVNGIVEKLYNLTILKRYSKIFAKVPEWAQDVFLKNDYREEACIPSFYNSEYKVHFLSQFFNAKRSFVFKKDKKEIDDIVMASSNAFDASDLELPGKYHVKTMGTEDIKPLAKLYKKAFKVYPFPIFKEKYLLKTMNNNVLYMGIFEDDNLVSAASSEIDLNGKNAEMTDFATDPKHRGQNLSYFLLRKMEAAMKRTGIKTVYTIARAKSYGMNKTFGRSHYRFGGTLDNNTQIGESIESMNVWHKFLK